MVLHAFFLSNLVARPCKFSNRAILSLESIALCFSCIAGYRAITPPPQRAPYGGVSQDCVRSMLLVSQLKLPSRSYRAIWGIAAILSQIVV